MALSDDDVREILRLIDETELGELRIETEGLSLHVVRGRAAQAERAEEPAPTAATADGAEPGRAAVRRRRHAYRARHDRVRDRGDEDDELRARGSRRHDRRGPRRERGGRRVRTAALPGDAGMTVDARPVEIVDTTT